MIGRFSVISELGQGGMATVYRAYDPDIKREVAIKVLPKQLMSESSYRQRFEREARTIANLEHDAIVPVYEFGEHEGQPFLVMRLMSGGSLADRLQKNIIPVSEIQEILSRIGSALDEAHKKGIVHRDLKPANILFNDNRASYLSDFGIVKVAESTTLTAVGQVVGTPAYMSPEQVMGQRDLDGRADIYALGAILFQMLTGQLPYQGTTTMAMALMHVNNPIPQLRDINPNIPGSYQAVINRAMAKDREQRYSSGTEMAAAFAAAGREAPGLVPLAAAATIVESPSWSSDSTEIVGSSYPPPPPPPKAAGTAQAAADPNWKIIGSAIFAAVALAALIFFILFWIRDGGSESDTTLIITLTSQAEMIAALENGKSAGATAERTGLVSDTSVDAALETEAPTDSPEPTETTAPTATAVPTNTPAPTDTPIPTNTPAPTNTPLPTDPPAPSARVVESFDYASSGDLFSAYWVNAPGNELTLSLVSSPVGGSAVAMDYRILNDPPSDYVGIEGNRASMDWRNFSKLCLWIQNGDYQGHMVVQFREMNGETWKTEIPMRNRTTGTVCLNLNESSFFKASHSGDQNNALDLEAIENIAFYLGAGGQTEGRVLLDAVQLSN